MFQFVSNTEIIVKAEQLFPQCVMDQKKFPEKAIEFHSNLLFGSLYSMLLIVMKLRAHVIHCLVIC